MLNPKKISNLIGAMSNTSLRGSKQIIKFVILSIAKNLIAE